MREKLAGQHAHDFLRRDRLVEKEQNARYRGGEQKQIKELEEI